MSDNENTEAKAGAWTEAAKFQFLLRIVAQFREEGRAINWSKVNMPGRTTKSLQNMWTKINKDIQALEQSGDIDTSTPKKASRKKTGEVGDDGEDTPSKTSTKKRGATGGASRGAKKAKVEMEEPDGSV